MPISEKKSIPWDKKKLRNMIEGGVFNNIRVVSIENKPNIAVTFKERVQDEEEM